MTGFGFDAARMYRYSILIHIVDWMGYSTVWSSAAAVIVEPYLITYSHILSYTRILDTLSHRTGIVAASSEGTSCSWAAAEPKEKKENKHPGCLPNPFPLPSFSGGLRCSSPVGKNPSLTCMTNFDSRDP